MKASKLFKNEERKEIEAAIASAEKMTSAEIVPVIASASGRYDRAEDIFGVILALIGLSIYWLYLPMIQTSSWSAGGDQPALWPVLLIIVIGFIFGAILATIIPALRLPFISRQEMQDEVERAARDVFQRHRIRNTAESNGVLLYISLYEHMVHVVGDDAINEKVTSEQWQSIVDQIVTGMKNGEAKTGVVKAIEATGNLLAGPFPWQEDDVNELVNTLRVID